MRNNKLLLAAALIFFTLLLSACQNNEDSLKIDTTTYINEDFQYSIDYPAAWEPVFYLNEEYPDKEATVFIAGERMEAFISIEFEVPSIEYMVSQKYYLVDAYEPLKGFMLLEFGLDHFAYLQQLEGEPVYYHVDHIIYHKDLFYAVQFRCDAKYYFENDGLPPELKEMGESFKFLS